MKLNNPEIPDGAYCSYEDFSKWQGKKKFGLELEANHQRCPEARVFLPLVPFELLQNGSGMVGFVYNGEFIGTYQDE